MEKRLPSESTRKRLRVEKILEIGSLILLKYKNLPSSHGQFDTFKILSMAMMAKLG